MDFLKNIVLCGNYTGTQPPPLFENSFFSLLHERTPHVERLLYLIKKIFLKKEGGSCEKPLAAAKQKVLEISIKRTKNLEETKKKNINPRLFRKLGCFTKTPSGLFFCFFGFIVCFGF